MQSLKLTKGENYSEFISTRLKEKIEKQVQENLLKISPEKSKKPCEISLIEVSPNGKIIVSIIDNNIFIKILNITSLEDQYNMHNSKVENHNTAFLPIYFDFDYGNEFSEMQRSFSILPPDQKFECKTLLLDLAVEKRQKYHQTQ